MKRIFSLMMILLLCFALPAGASPGGFRGFTTIGGYSDSNISFAFEPDFTVLVYNNEVEPAPNFGEIWPDSDIYVPVYVWDEAPAPASDKDIKNNDVTLSWKSTGDGQYIDDVTLVNGKKAKIEGLGNNIYAKIDLGDDFSGRTPELVRVDLALSVNRVAYPETLTILKFNLVNREIKINRNTVYAAQSPTQFYAMKHYGGRATFDFGDNITYNATVQKGRRYYLNLDRTPDEEIQEQYPDAYLEFYNFRGERDTFTTQGQLKIPIDRAAFTAKGETKARVFAYRVQGVELTALDEESLGFNGKKDILTIHTNILESYLLSNEPLHMEVEDESDRIIYTGYALDDINEPVDDATASSTAASSASASSTAAVTAASSTAATDSSSASSSDESTRVLPESIATYTGFLTDGPPVSEEPKVTTMAITATNRSAENPETSDIPLAPIVACGLFSGSVVIYGWRRGWQKRIRKKDGGTA
jgi:hypothetical protein